MDVKGEVRMQNVDVVIVWMICVIILQVILLYMSWKEMTDLTAFKKKVNKILFPPSLGKKGKVIPYRK